MVFKLALLSNLFLAFVALAVPSSQLLGVPRGEDNQSQTSDRFAASVFPQPVEPYNADWAGAQGNIALNSENFGYIFGSFIVPALNPDKQSGGVSGFGVAVVVGNTACRSVILSGVEIKFENGVTSYEVVYGLQLDKTVKYPYDPGSIMPGDQIKLTAHATSAFSGVAMVENVIPGNGRQGWGVSMGLGALPGNPLCSSAVQWIVYDYIDPKTHRYVPIANFDRVTFFYGIAAKIDFTTDIPVISNITPRDATLTDIVRDIDHRITATSKKDIVLTIEYIQRP